MSVTGVQGEERQDYTKDENRQIRRRSLGLLGSLLAPLRKRLIVTSIVVVACQLVSVAGPLLIAYGINNGIAALKDQGDWQPTLIAVIAYLAAAVLGAVLMQQYQISAAKISQAVLIDLRKRVFDHAQRLSLEFHESYTSGRIIARQTSDLDSIRELLDSGLTA